MLTAQEKSDTSWTFKCWYLEQQQTNKKYSGIDTLLPYYEINNPVWRKNFTATYLGNLGTAAESNIFPQRFEPTEFILFKPIEYYTESSERVMYYSTKKPFTILSYSSGGQKSTQEQVLQAIHTQNVNQKLNFGIIYTLYSSVGNYPNQQAKDNAFAFCSNYHSPRYELHGNIVINKLNIEENGGILADTVPEQGNLSYIPVNLEFAASKYFHMGGLITQSLHFGRFPWSSTDSLKKDNDVYLSTLHYTIRYDRYLRSFKVSSLNSFSSTGDNLTDSAYFKHFYESTEESADSVFFRKFSQQLQLELHESPKAWFKFKGRAGVFHELFSYPYNSKKQHDFNAGINATLVSIAGRHLAWTFNGQYVLVGYNAFDYQIGAQMKTVFNNWQVRVEAGRQAERPEFYLRRYFSNNVAWDFPGSGHDLAKSETSWLKGEIEGPSFLIMGDLRWMDHYVFFTDSMPAQPDKGFAVATVTASKLFHLGKFYSQFQASLQHSGSDVVHLPLVAIRNSTRFEQSLVKNVLMGNLGFDVYYFTSYYADGYNPALGEFFVQKEKKIGNYPFIDVFLNFKLKRTRIMLKYEHVNSGLFLPQTYFTAWHYPMQPRMLKFGVSWTFYD